MGSALPLKACPTICRCRPVDACEPSGWCRACAAWETRATQGPGLPSCRDVPLPLLPIPALLALLLHMGETMVRTLLVLHIGMLERCMLLLGLRGLLPLLAPLVCWQWRLLVVRHAVWHIRLLLLPRFLWGPLPHWLLLVARQLQRERHRGLARLLFPGLLVVVVLLWMVLGPSTLPWLVPSAWSCMLLLPWPAMALLLLSRLLPCRGCEALLHGPLASSCGPWRPT